MRPVETPGSRDFKILKDGDPPVSRGLTPRPATGAHEGARLQAQHCKPILPPGRVSEHCKPIWPPGRVSEHCKPILVPASTKSKLYFEPV